jgi:hypothetical protein
VLGMSFVLRFKFLHMECVLLEDKVRTFKVSSSVHGPN